MDWCWFLNTKKYSLVVPCRSHLLIVCMSPDQVHRFNSVYEYARHRCGNIAGLLMFVFKVLATFPYAQLWKSFVVRVTPSVSPWHLSGNASCDLISTFRSFHCCCMNSSTYSLIDAGFAFLEAWSIRYLIHVLKSNVISDAPEIVLPTSSGSSRVSSSVAFICDPQFVIISKGVPKRHPMSVTTIYLLPSPLSRSSSGRVPRIW